MSRRRRPFLAAVVSPEAAYVITHGAGAQIELLASRQPEWLARKVLASLDQMREAGRQWVEGVASEQAGARGGDLDGGDGRELTVAEAAALLEVSAERVRQLARDGVILGRQVKGRRWLLAGASVQARRNRRREAS